MILFNLLEEILSTDSEADFILKVKILWKDRKKLQDAFKDYADDLATKEKTLRFAETKLEWLTDENKKLKQNIEDIKKDRNALLETHKSLKSKLDA